MAEVISSYQVATFIVPSNLTTADADQVRGNDNTLRSSLNQHDADAGIHFQSSTLAARPAAGQVGRKWATTDDRRIWIDNGATWEEVSYASTADPTFTGTVTAADLTVSGTFSVGTFDVATIDSATSLTLIGSVAAGLWAQGGDVSITASEDINLQAQDDILLAPGNLTRWRVKWDEGLLPELDSVYDIGSASKRVAVIHALLLHTGSIQVSGDQVVGPRETGWGSAGGTLTRTAFTTDSVTLPQLAARVGALLQDLQNHGLIGA